MVRVRQYMFELRRSGIKLMCTETMKMLWLDWLMKMDLTRSSALLFIILTSRVSEN